MNFIFICTIVKAQGEFTLPTKPYMYLIFKRSMTSYRCYVVDFSIITLVRI